MNVNAIRNESGTKQLQVGLAINKSEGRICMDRRHRVYWPRDLMVGRSTRSGRTIHFIGRHIKSHRTDRVLSALHNADKSVAIRHARTIAAAAVAAAVDELYARPFIAGQSAILAVAWLWLALRVGTQESRRRDWCLTYGTTHEPSLRVPWRVDWLITRR